MIVIQQQVIEILRSITNKNEIVDNSRLVDDLGFTSLDMIVFICSIEQKFNMQIKVADVMTWKTVLDVTEWLISNKQGEK